VRSRLIIAGLLSFVVIAPLFLYNQRFDRPVLYYYGASPDAPQGTAIPILNPFRDRKDEANAQWLIKDLRTNQCEQIVRDRLAADPTRICSVLKQNTSASLVWLDPVRDRSGWRRSRKLYYDLPDSKSRLVVLFGPSEAGWGVVTVTLLR
jgi:hypothetical protein